MVFSVSSQRAVWEHWRGRSEQRGTAQTDAGTTRNFCPLAACASTELLLLQPCREPSAPGKLSLARLVCLNVLALLYINASLGAVLNHSVVGPGRKAFTQRNRSDFTIWLQDCPPCTGGCWSRPRSQPASAPRRGIKELAQPAPGPPGSCLLMPPWSPALGSPFPPYKYSIVLAKTYCTREQGMFQRIPETGSLCCSPT